MGMCPISKEGISNHQAEKETPWTLGLTVVPILRSTMAPLMILDAVVKSPIVREAIGSVLNPAIVVGLMVSLPVGHTRS